MMKTVHLILMVCGLSCVTGLSARTTETDIETGIVLSNGELSDEVNFWITDGMTEAFEYNADFPKMMNDHQLNIYGVHSAGALSWIAISPEIAAGSMAIGYQVPAAGTYTLSMSEDYYTDELPALCVIDYGVTPHVCVDLMKENYQFTTTEAETNDTRFVVSTTFVEFGEDNPTAVGQVTTNKKQTKKFIYNNQMYLLSNGVVYNILGNVVQ